MGPRTEAPTVVHALGLFRLFKNFLISATIPTKAGCKITFNFRLINPIFCLTKVSLKILARLWMRRHNDVIDRTGSQHRPEMSFCRKVSRFLALHPDSAEAVETLYYLLNIIDEREMR